MKVIRRVARALRQRIFGSSEQIGLGNRKIFFLHLPKCGGSSIREALSTVCPDEKIAALNPHASRRAAEARGEDMLRYRALLLPYYMAREDVQVLTGHFSWSTEAYEHFGDDWSYVTLLRDPVQRWFSHYFYDRYKSHSDHFKIEDGLDTFLASDRAREMGNLYARRLTDPTHREASDVVKQAKENLDKFDIVGVVEHIDNFVSRLSNQAETKVEVSKKNESPSQERKKNALKDEKYVGKVREICKKDKMIYDFAIRKASK
jgi:hypothetical protein